MIAFRPITIDDRDWMSEKLREDDRQGCEYSFANNFIWSVIYKSGSGRSLRLLRDKIRCRRGRLLCIPNWSRRQEGSNYAAPYTCKRR